MEHAIIINRIEDFKLWKKKYTRIYFGNEFCPKLLPNKKEMDIIINMLSKKDLKLTFLTSYADSNGLEIIKEAIEYLDKSRALGEVVVNDYGVFSFIKKKYPNCEIVLGRAMSSKTVSLFQDSFFYKNDVRRIEYNTLSRLMKVVIENKNTKIDPCTDINLSLYYPYAVISTTRYCPVVNLKNRKKNHGIIDCNHECLTHGEFKLLKTKFTKTMYLKGNSIFLKEKNKYNNTLIKRFNINRLIYQPKLPI